ncbi:MAG: ArnT family glycosyltransferase [Weeksellaceae bacterium]
MKKTTETSSTFLSKQIIVLLLVVATAIAAILHCLNSGFPPLNSDEAAFGYNTYSIVQTGRDEYGNLLPTRFKSFGEYKLPLMGYLSVPFVAVLGLNELSTRAVVILIGIASPLLFYAIAQQLFKNNRISITAAFLAALTPWIQMTSRHAHEAIVAYLFLMLSFIITIKLLEQVTIKRVILLAGLNVLALFSHHIAKPYSVFLLLWLGIALWQQRLSRGYWIKTLLIFLIPIAIFMVTELQHPSNRIGNLVFYNNQGFTLAIDEMRGEDNNRIIHNKAIQGVSFLTNQYLSYFSPEFLVTNGDQNERFGYAGISPISVVEYVLALIGLYFLFHLKNRYRYFIVSLLLTAPLTASLSWAGYSLTRSFMMIVPILLLASYGAYNLVLELKQNSLRRLVIIGSLAAYLFFIFLSWDFYFNHYPKRAQAIRAWTSGYKELGSYLKANYERFDKFYITKKHGQPYIYTLFYLNYPPAKYQDTAELSTPDEYGFGQVERFDKFEFNFKQPTAGEKAAYIGFPDDFQGTGIEESQVKKIQIGTETIFWIYES